MEEIQPAGVLDREILEDARKKASRTLKAAQDRIDRAEKEQDARTAEAIASLEQNFGRRFENARDEIMARLPLDKKRARLAKIDALLRGAGRDFLGNMGNEKGLSLLEREFARRAGELGDGGGGSLRVRFHDIDKTWLQGILEKYAPSWRPSLEEESGGSGGFPAFSTDTGAVRAGVSLEAALENLLDECRGELAAALLGEEVLDA